MDIADWKRRLRSLKKTEIRVRFGTNAKPPPGVHLVWDEFFGKGARYPIEAVQRMSGEVYRAVMSEYYLRVYNRLYDERGIGHDRQFDADVLALLGLPYDAAERDVKRRFHELIIANHPDTGGEPEALLRILDRYQGLFDK